MQWNLSGFFLLVGMGEVAPPEKNLLIPPRPPSPTKIPPPPVDSPSPTTKIQFPLPLNNSFQVITQ